MDNSFSTDTLVAAPSQTEGKSGSYARTIQIDSRGRTLVAGCIQNRGGGLDMILWRYTKKGVLDSTFGIHGRVVYKHPLGERFSTGALDMVLDSQGRIVVTGFAFDAELRKSMAIWRYTPRGKVDKSFFQQGYRESVSVHLFLNLVHKVRSMKREGGVGVIR